MRIARRALTPRATAENTPASNNAVPVAESRFSVKMAFSGVAFGATGGIFSTARFNAGTAMSGANAAWGPFFGAGGPHAKTNPVKKTHGSQAFHAGPAATAVAAASAPTGESAGALSDSSRGCQN